MNMELPKRWCPWRCSRRKKIRRIESHSLHIEISDVADESEDSLRFYLENLTCGTVANEAKFEIQRVRIPMHCLKYGKEFEKEDMAPRCPCCHSTPVVQDRLDEFKLSSIEIE